MEAHSRLTVIAEKLAEAGKMETASALLMLARQVEQLEIQNCKLAADCDRKNAMLRRFSDATAENGWMPMAKELERSAATMQ